MSTRPDRTQITDTVIATVTNITQDWSLSADVRPDTRLISELGFTSMDAIDLFAMLDIAFQSKLPFEQFAVVGANGEYRQEFTIADVAEFVDTHFETPRAGGVDAV
ncbi:MAG: acyl carrier protein [Acidobacteria bacterium]|nr:acyl carrier protein [Acidobacteriota bacterium]